MKTNFVLILILLAVWAGFVSLDAKTVVLDPLGDCIIDSSDADTTFADDTSLWPAKIGTSGSPGIYRIAYVQYQLPSDIEEITAVKLRLVQTTNVGSFSYYVYQLKDAVTQPDVNTYTWNNAPGNDPADTVLGTGGRYDPTTAVYASYVVTSRLDPVGTEYVVDLNAAGLDEIKLDADGIVTYFAVRRQISTADSGLAALENPDYHPIQLEVTYTPIPEAAVLVDTGDGLVVNELGETSDSYTVALASTPTEPVTVEFDYDQTQFSLNPTSLSFGPGDPGPKNVTVSAIDDSLSEGDTIETITHTAVSNDYNYMFAAQVEAAVTVTDNDISTVIINATTDSEVKKFQPDTAFPLGDLAPLTGDTASNLVFSYMRFILPEDFAFATDAEFRMVRTAVAGIDSIIYLVCVYDDIEQGDVETYTWNTAPGVNPTADPNSSPLYNTEESIYVGTISAGASGAAGEEFVSQESTNWRLANQLNLDTDRVITLFLVRPAVANEADQWASSENVSYHPPQLALTYSDTRYCGQPGQTYSLGDINRDCYVNLFDLIAFIREW